MPVATTTNKQATLIDFASILTLEKALHQSGKHLPKVGMPAKDWLSLGQPLDDWIEIAATHLANAIVASCSLIDFEAQSLMGLFPKKFLSIRTLRDSNFTAFHVRLPLKGAVAFD